MALLDYDAVSTIGDDTASKQVTLSGQSIAIAESAIALMRDSWLWSNWHEDTVGDLDHCLAELQLATGEGVSSLIGTIVFWYSTDESPPPNLLVCDGSEYNTTTYADLYDLLGVDTVPDLLDLYPKMTDTAQDTGGANSHTLSISQMPSHHHNNSPNPVETFVKWVGSGGGGGLAAGGTVTTLATIPSGGGGAHNNEPAYITLVPCIVAL